jgi:nucleoside-diphosphate-sugar epimerase
MRVCVVGGTGNISTGIVQALLEFGHEVSVFTRGSRESRLPSGVHYLRGDRQDRLRFEATMQAARFDAAIDMIAFTPEDAASALRAFRDVRHLLHCSSVVTFGGPLATVPADETTPLRPVTEYARNKVGADQVLRAADQRGDVPITIFKPGYTWGPGFSLIRQLDYDSVWIDRVRKHKPLIVSGDGQALWSLCHSRDAGRAFAAAVDRTSCKGQDYIVTGDRWITWQEYHERVNAVLGSRSEIVHVPADTILASPLAPKARQLAAGSYRNGCFSIAKLRRDIPEFVPAINLEEGLPELIDWLDRHGAIGNCEEDTTEDRLIDAQRGVAPA